MGKYYNTRDSVEEYIRLAKGYDGKQNITLLKEFLPSGSELLEIGSGPGTDWQILNKFYKVLGSDLSKEFLKHLRATYPGGEFIELDATTLETDRTFHGIYSNKVLHHLEDEDLEASVKRQFEILNPGGIVCHSFWKGEDSEIYNDLFVNYQLESGIRALFQDTFDTLLVKFYKEFEEGDSILYIGKKKERQHS